MKMFITAISNNNVISVDGKIPFITPDMAMYFTATTIGNIVVMGYNTWVANNELALPGRINVVLTRNPKKIAKQKNVVVCTSPEQVLKYIGDKEAWVIGGVKTFYTFLPYCDEVQAIRSNMDNCILGTEPKYLDIGSQWKVEFEEFDGEGLFLESYYAHV